MLRTTFDSSLASATALFVAAIAVVLTGPAHAISVRDDVAAAAGGLGDFFDAENAFPSVGNLNMGCTGSLINARTLLTAAHCFESQVAADADGSLTAISFRPDAPPIPVARAQSVLVHPEYDKDVFARRDVAMVALDQPITDISPIPLATMDPATGQLVYIVGFGKAVLASEPGDVLDDQKRRVVTNILDFVGLAGELPVGDPLPADQPVMAVDVDHAPEDGRFNSLGTAVPTAWEGGGAPGDSGGPLYLLASDGSFIQVGVLTGGAIPTTAENGYAANVDGKLMLGYGGLTLWQSVPFFSNWIFDNGFLRSASAVSEDGLWSSPSHWSGGVVPSNSIGYVPEGAARYYDVSLSEPGMTVLDMSPRVDRLRVSHPQAGLLVGAPHALTVEVETALATGSLMVAGSLTTPWLGVSGGILSGSGRVTAPQGVVQTGGVVSPGGAGAIGTLSVTGSFIQEAGVLLAELSSSEADRLVVSGGSVSLAGGLQVELLGMPPAVGSQFTVVTGDSVEALALPALSDIGAVTFSLSSSHTAVEVLVGRRPLSGFGLDGKGFSVGNALDGLRGNAAFTPVLDSLDVVPGAQIGRALDQIGRVSTVGAGVSQAMSAQFLGAVSQRVAGVRSGTVLGRSNARALGLLLTPDIGVSVLQVAKTVPDGEQMVRPRFYGPMDGQQATVAEGPVFALGRDSGVGGTDLAWGFWAQPYGMRASRRGENAGSRHDTIVGGMSAGLDYRFRGNGSEEGLLAGISLGYARADTDYRELTDRSQQRSYQLGVYGGRWRGPWSVDTGLGFALNRYENRRDMNFGTVNASAEGRSGGREYTAYAEGRYRHEVSMGGRGRLEVVPMAGVQVLRLHEDGYTENGAGILNLTVSSNTVTSVRSSIGAALAYPMALSGGRNLRPEVRARWSHEFADTDSVLDAGFASAPGTAFRIRSDELTRHVWLLGAGLEAKFGSRANLSLAYDAQLRKGYTAHALTGRVRIVF